MALFSRKSRKSAPRTADKYAPLKFAAANAAWRDFYPGGNVQHISDTVWNDPRVSRDSARYQ